MATPTRSTSDIDLNRWNTAMRASPVYQAFMRSIGNDGSGHVTLSRDQQTALEQALTRSGITIPSGMHIDQGGNLNQKNRLARNVGIGAAATGAALTGFGLAGMGPLAGLGGAAGAADTAGAAMLGGGGAGVSAGTAGAAIPTIAGTAYGTGMAASAPSIAGAAGGSGTAAAAGGAGSGWVNKAIQVGENVLPPVVAKLASSGSEKSISPESQALIDQQRARMEQANPLYESVLRLAMQRLPTSASAGLSVPTYDQANASIPPVSSGNYAEDPATRNLLRTQLVRAKMSDPVLQAVLRLSQSRMPTARG